MTVPNLSGVKVRPRRGGESWQVTAKGVHGVQRLAVCSVDVAALTELELKVESWRPPTPGWLGRPELAGITHIDMGPEGVGARVRIRMAQPTDAALVLAAAVRCLRPVPAVAFAPEITFATGVPESAAALAPSLRDVYRADEKRDKHLRRCDVLVLGEGAPDPGVERASTVVVGVDTWARDGNSFEVSVDPTIHRPLGRRSTDANVVATGVLTGNALMVRGGEALLRLEGEVTAAEARALRTIGAIVVDGHVGDRLLRQLNACGVLVVSDRQHLPEPDDHLAWQARSVFERRHALRQFGPTAAFDAWPTVSVVLSTHRPDHLDRALASVAGLRYPRLEVIVGAHGPTVDPARVWQMAQEVPHPVTVVPIEAERTLGEALQACTERAQGALITKMDDDDVYGPEHIWDLVLARQYSGAQLVGKALDWVYIESENTTVFRPAYAAEKYADFVAGGTILIARADLLALGGWRPVPKSVDRALLDRVLAAGGLVYRTHGLGYVYVRHQAGHTASVQDAHFLTKVVERIPGMISHEAFGTVAG